MLGGFVIGAVCFADPADAGIAVEAFPERIDPGSDHFFCFADALLKKLIAVDFRHFLLRKVFFAHFISPVLENFLKKIIFY